MSIAYPSSADLPRNPPTYDKWRATRPNYLNAYGVAYKAERHAKTKFPLQEAKTNAMFARVAGYLLVELFDRRAVLTESPCESLAQQLTSPHRNGGTAHDVVFQVGKLMRDHLLRLCTFGFGLSCGVSISGFLQSGHRACDTQLPLHTPHALPSTGWWMRQRTPWNLTAKVIHPSGLRYAHL